MKRLMTLKEKAMLKKGSLGLIWISMGVIQLMQANIILKVILLCLLLAGTFLTLLPSFIKAEAEDEMSRYNDKKAKVAVYELLFLIILICALIITIKGGLVIDLKTIIPFILGGINSAEFILFVYYEKVGA